MPVLPAITKSKFEHQPSVPLEPIAHQPKDFFPLSIGKAISWTVLTVLLQLTALAGALIVISGLGITASTSSATGSDQYRWKLTLLMQALFLAQVMLCCRWSLKESLGNAIGMLPVSIWHSLLIVLMVFPMAIVSSQLHLMATAGWKALLTAVPQLQVLDGPQSMEMVASLMSSTPLWAMMLMIAVIPALGEELIFRGMISRGLTARYGFLTGMLVSTLLFAVVHMHPVHALALIPMGCLLHVVYFATRSFWAPVLLHFCNNLLAVLMSYIAVHSPSTTGITLSQAEQQPSVLMTAGCVASLCVLTAMLWNTRIRSSAPAESSTEWTTGVMTVSPQMASV